MAAQSNNEHVMFVPEVTGLKDMGGQIFFIIYKNLGPGQYTPVYKSETKAAANNKLNWNTVQIGTTDLCKDDIEKEIKIEFFKFNSSGKHKNLGHTQAVTLATLKEGKNQYGIVVKGQMMFNFLKVEKTHSFLEYVFGGCQVDLTIAIDFTLSNRPPNDPSSLHYFDPNRNQYLAAIRNVGDILQYYNSDK